MKFSEFGSKLENSEMYTESEKKELKNKLMEAKEKVKELKKLQADKMAGKKTVKVKESWDDDDEDPDVAKAEKELKKKGVKLPKVKGVDPDKDISKLAKKSKKEDDLDESWDDDEDDDVKKADAELKKMGKKPIKAHAKVDPDKDISKLAKKSKKDDDDLDESADKKAKKDYDGDGEVESEKDEVWGSRMKAAKKSGKMKESAKPDFLDVDKDGDKKEPMKKASKEKKVSEESKPSAGLSKAQKSATVKKAKAGGDIGKPGKGFAKVEKAAKAGGAKDPKAVAAAAMWKNIKREEASDEENDVISAPQPAPIPPTTDPDGGSAPRMYESIELGRIKMLSGLK